MPRAQRNVYDEVIDQPEDVYFEDVYLKKRR
jgi:hypothetical protein